MKTVTMLEFRQNAEGVLRRIAKGERLVPLRFEFRPNTFPPWPNE